MEIGMEDGDQPLPGLVGTVVSISPAQWCQAFFILASCLVSAVASLPESARRHMLDYGARSSKPEKREEDEDRQREGRFEKLVAMLTSWGQVPHSWFLGFYTTSLACSVFWLVQYLVDGRVLHLLAARQAATSTSGTPMQSGQVVLLWTMMFLQASRRLYEQLTMVKHSNSTMWIVHWLLGISYYGCMSVSVWIEGAEPILQRRLTSPFPGLYSPKCLAATLVYLFAWTSQYQCHKHLAGLKKYSLPDQGMFSFLLCPHYTCECLLYLSMAVAGAPQGALYNKTLLWGLAFVVTNLGATAGGTRKWYKHRFGADAVDRKWNMIPLLF